MALSSGVNRALTPPNRTQAKAPLGGPVPPGARGPQRPAFDPNKQRAIGPQPPNSMGISTAGGFQGDLVRGGTLDQPRPGDGLTATRFGGAQQAGGLLGGLSQPGGLREPLS